MHIVEWFRLWQGPSSRVRHAQGSCSGNKGTKCRNQSSWGLVEGDGRTRDVTFARIMIFCPLSSTHLLSRSESILVTDQFQWTTDNLKSLICIVVQTTYPEFGDLKRDLSCQYSLPPRGRPAHIMLQLPLFCERLFLSITKTRFHSADMNQ